MTDRQTTRPRFGVIIPVYLQPQFLLEAVSSAAGQTLAGESVIMVVNDGCPLAETHELGLIVESTYPNLEYVRSENGGPAAARNLAIRLLLERHPGIEAFFFLDSDNYAEPQTMERLAETMEQHASDWAYSDLKLFGIREGIWQFPSSMNEFRQHFENQCDVGSIVHRRVFDAGVWFDEEMSAYEDWEFFLRATVAGFRGVSAGLTGLNYRQRPHSRNYKAQTRHDEVHDEIKRRLAERFGGRALAQLEHRTMPRYAAVEVDTGRVSWFTLPAEPPQRVGKLAELQASLVTSDYGRLDEPYVPPVVMLTTSSALPVLAELKLLPALLLRIQERLREASTVEIGLRRAEEPTLLHLVCEQPEPDELVALALSTRALAGETIGDGRRAALTVSAVEPGEPSSLRRADIAETLGVLSEKRRMRRWRFKPGVDGLESHSEFAASRHITALDTTFPSASSRRSALILVPWLGLGGADLCVARLAAALHAQEPIDLHLVSTTAAPIETDAANLEPFATVTPLGDLPSYEAGRLLLQMARSADLILNAHSLLGYELLGELRAAGNAQQLAYLHVIDTDPFGLPAGYPVWAARQHEGQLDLMIVPSRALRNSLLNLGVPDEKVCIAPNAPAFAPSSLEAGLVLAEEKARRTADQDRPLRLLFAGRLDRQKGVTRLARAARQLSRRGFPYRLTILGKPVMDEESADFPDECEFVEPVFSSAGLTRHYEDADVVLLPSRWEGLPLTLLDAMAFGCVTITTDVGAISEVVENGVNGILLSNEPSDEEIGDRVADAVTRLAGGDGSASLRKAAVKGAFARSWDEAARQVLASQAFGAERVAV